MLFRLVPCCVAIVVVCGSVSRGQTETASWQVLDARAAQLYEQGDLSAATEAARAALAAAANPSQSGRSLDRLGFFIYTAGNIPEAEKYLRESLRVREAAFGRDSLEYSETENDLAMLLRDVRKMDDARAAAEHAVAVREQQLGAQALPLAESLNTLGTVLGLGGDYAAAVTQFERAKSIHERLPERERATEEYGTLCVNLAGTYQRIGRYDAAETAFQKGLDALRVKPGIQHPAYATSVVAYANLEVDLGRYVDAERLYAEGGRLMEEELGSKHPLYAALLNNRGMFYQAIGNVAAADADYRRALDLKRELYGPDSPLAISTLRNLAHLTYGRDRAAGEKLLAEAVDRYSRVANPPPFDFTSVLVGLAEAQRDRGALADARATAERAREVSRKGLGEQHPLFAAATRELGLTLAASGDADGAEAQLEQALTVAEQVHGPMHPDVATFIDALANFFANRRDFSRATALYARSVDVRDRFWRDVVQIGSERFKAASLADLTDPIAKLIALQAAAPDVNAARTLAFEVVASRKGRILDHVRDWRSQLDAASSDAVRARLQQWQALLGCRTSLTLALGYRDLKPAVAASCTLTGTDLAGRYERLLSDLRTRWTAELGTRTVAAIQVLQDRADAIETVLNRDTGTSNQDDVRPTIAALRERLPSGEALIELVAYSPESERRLGGATPRYGAFVLTDRTLAWADLGARAPIDRSVGDLLTAANDWSTSLSHHEPSAARASMETAQAAVAELSRSVWRPIAATIDSTAITRLRIAPDGLLNLVPFEALSDGRALIDRFAISYVPAGRDLAEATASNAERPAVVVVSSGDLTRTAGSPPSARSASATGELEPLRAAAAEAADVRRVLAASELYADAAATEQHVKNLHRPSLLHIVGHGVVRGQDTCADRTCLPLDRATQAMSLAAIVLEEAYGRSGRSSDDGWLTALELENLDLRGTQMLVLSQCQMATGLASVGEGVYGMRRAAFIAGVQSFVAPLWNVEDTVQRRLMTGFYQRLAAGESRVDALRHAKLSLRRSPATASFLYWAPVILSGQPSAVSPSLFRR